MRLRLLFFCLLCLFGAGARARADDVSELAALLDGQGYAPVKLHFIGDSHLEAPGSVNGVAARFVVDTGAMVTLLDPSQVERLELKAQSTNARLIGGLGRQDRLQAALATSFRVGSVDMRPFMFGVTPLDANEVWVRSGERAIEGIIGAELLRANQWIIDYAGMRLWGRIDGPAGSGRAALASLLRRQGYREVPLARSSYSEFEFRARVNDKPTVMLLDTGSGGTLLDRGFARLAGIVSVKSDAMIAGVRGGEQRLARGQAKTFRAGAFHTKGVPLSITDLRRANRRLQAEGRAQLGGYLGSEFLRSKDAIIDCANLKLYLRD